MKTVCAFLLLVLAAGCCDCGWCNCCGSACPAPGAAAPYAAQRQSLPTTEPSPSTTQVAKAGTAASGPERQVEYYDGKQQETYLR